MLHYMVKSTTALKDVCLFFRKSLQNVALHGEKYNSSERCLFLSDRAFRMLHDMVKSTTALKDVFFFFRKSLQNVALHGEKYNSTERCLFFQKEPSECCIT